jgi:hypothetical protein
MAPEQSTLALGYEKCIEHLSYGVVLIYRENPVRYGEGCFSPSWEEKKSLHRVEVLDISDFYQDEKAYSSIFHDVPGLYV